jgi:YidC/Oxa1 family membrane protein insertase
MDFLYNMLATVMAAIYSAVPSYGFTIAALTLAVMVVLTPLTLKGTRSMMMMQQLQPEMKKLQSRYKDDRQKLNEELLKFYKENNINPVGGCLPLLIQMPVFIVLYNVLRGLTLRIPITGGNIGWVVGQTNGLGAGGTKPPVVHTNFLPKFVPTDSAMYHDLTGTNFMSFSGFWKIDLSQSAQEAITQGAVHALPFLLLIVVVGISGFVQQRQIQGRQGTNTMPQQQQQIMKIMPIFLPLVSFGLPSGLVLYFAVSNLYRIGQQWFISRSIYGLKRGQTLADLEAEKKAGSKGTGPSGSGKGGRPTDKGPAPKGPSKGPSTGQAKKRSANGDAAPTNDSSSKAAKATSRTGAGKTGAVAGSNGKSTNGKDQAPAATKAGKATKTAGPDLPPVSKPPSTPAGGTSVPPLQPRARKKKR